MQNLNRLTIGENPRINEKAIVGSEPLRSVSDLSVTIGNNLIALAGAIIYRGVKIGNDAALGHYAIVREENIIGDSFRLWSNSIVDYGCVIGNRVKIHSGCYVAQYTVIEDDVFLAPGVIIGNDPHPGCEFSTECIKKSGVTIRQGAQIGINCTILPGVTIGKKALIGAGSVVTEDVPAEKIVVGNPAKILKSIYEAKCTNGLTEKPYLRVKR